MRARGGCRWSVAPLWKNFLEKNLKVGTKVKINPLFRFLAGTHVLKFLP
jgi:hypothetical protein